MFNVLVGYQYRSTAVVTSEPPPSDPDQVQLVDTLYPQPGTCVPRTWVRRGTQKVSTLDLLSPRFTLLTGDDSAAWRQAAAKVSAALHVPITVHSIGAERDVADIDGRWAATTRLAPDAAVLIRPDDFVGWHAETTSADPAADLHHAL